MSRYGLRALALLMLAAGTAPAQESGTTPGPNAGLAVVPLVDDCDVLKAERAAGHRLTIAQSTQLITCYTDPAPVSPDGHSGYQAYRPPGLQGDPQNLLPWHFIERYDG